MWRVYPEGLNKSLVVFSSRLDMRDANYITRQLASEGNAVNRTINVAVAMVTLLEVKTEAERRAGTYVNGKFATMPLRRPRVDMNALRPLLGRGDLVLMDLDGNTLQSVAVVGRTGTSERRVRRVMLDPEEFGKSLLHGTCAQVTEHTDEGTKFEWEIPIPLLHVGGEMVLRPSPTVIAVDGISGTLSRGQWRFDTHRYPGGEAGVIAWATFDANTRALDGPLVGVGWFFAARVDRRVRGGVDACIDEKTSVEIDDQRTSADHEGNAGGKKEQNGIEAHHSQNFRIAVAPAPRVSIRKCALSRSRFLLFL